MMRVEVRTQAEMETAIRAGDTPICIEGSFVLLAGMSVEARGSSHVEARGSSHVVARGSSHVVARGASHVEAWESSRVVARGSSHVVARGASHVEAWESSHVVARGSSHVVARGAAIVRVFACKTVTASPMVTVVIHGSKEGVTGGIQIELKLPCTPREWCEFYGVPVATDGTVVLFKGVGANFRSPRGGDYTPGTVPIASDWDGGSAECGGGLHFSPNPRMTLEFCPDAQHFIACPVRLTDIIVHKNASYPQKVKVAGCCGACWECDRDGNRIEQPALANTQEKTA